MKITFCCVDTKPEPWLLGLRNALPQARVSLWQSGDEAADYAVVWSPPQQFFDEQVQLKAVFNIGAGVDALLKLRWPPTAKLVRLEDAGMAVQMAEYVCQAVIRHFRELDAIESAMRQGQWGVKKPRLRQDYPVGVLGLGVLGQRVARALTTFEFPVLGFSRTPKHIAGVTCLHGDAQWGEFLRGTRILVNLLPLTKDTRGILSRETLGCLQSGAYLINVARGAHLVDQDLVALIQCGHLAGATLDVFHEEPLPPEHVFWREPRITMTPHTSARTLREDTIAQIASKLGAVLRGEKISGEVNVARGY